MNWIYPDDFMNEFVQLYGTMPSLWKQGSQEYRDYEMKTRDLADLLEKFREVEPSATKAFLLQKLSLLRRQYRDERRKFLEQGIPMREWFNTLSFLPDPPSLKRKRLYSDPLDVDPTYLNEECVISPVNSSEDTKPNSPLDEVQDITIKGENTDEYRAELDHFDHITKAWTSSLECMPRPQQIIAERIINNILFEAQVGNLTIRSPIEISQLFHKQFYEN